MLFSLLSLSGMILTFVALKVNCAEYETKVKVGYNFTKGDSRFTKRKTMLLALMAFIVALLSAACGIGPGLIFNPILI